MGGEEAQVPPATVPCSEFDGVMALHYRIAKFNSILSNVSY